MTPREKLDTMLISGGIAQLFFTILLSVTLLAIGVNRATLYVVNVWRDLFRPAVAQPYTPEIVPVAPPPPAPDEAAPSVEPVYEVPLYHNQVALL